MTELLCIPLKQTGDVDLVKPIKSIISSSRSVTTADLNSLTELQNLRSKMVAAIKNQQFTEATLEEAQNYFDQIGHLELKIPFIKTKIYFKWLDAFDRGSWFGGSIPYTMSTNLLYEKACVLFNIASLSTQVGAAQDLATEDGMKKAVKMFQLAAGIFSAVSTPPPASPSEQKPTPDLSPESAAALSSLCLAQAQEVVLQKAMMDNKKDAIIAKLARHTDILYTETASLMQKETVKGLWDKTWFSIVTGKQAMYSGLVQFHQARVCKAEKTIGQEIARLQLARELLIKSEPLLVQGGQGGAQKWVDLCDTSLQEAKKDNEFIYFEKVPPVEELVPVEGAAVVKPSPLPDKFLIGQASLFGDLAALDNTAKKAECVVS
eukprot:TRINITY_DN14162_c0_g1_i1.p1 TRINITY_DN14162_c0_g1~~TRINITY_DN14162_c0_g1_i1.p1  ORF type:complete len:399 (+),score=173.33 TRINITY_DN14162_c0_g1_i1:68-1198(+)